jgi:sugar O-acyltransferase (sialic acid O-acetyltransferase NeuD family)
MFTNANMFLAECNHKAKPDVIIFGEKDLAELAYYYLTKDSEMFNVSAFTVSREYYKNSSITMPDGKVFDVVVFEDLPQTHSPDKFSLFAPMTGIKMNTARKSIYETGKALGYSFVSYISSKATTFDNTIGENCFILEDNTIQPYTTIGNNVVMWSGNHIGHHGRVGDHVFFTSHVVMSGHCDVQDRAWLGVNATLRDGIVVGEGSLIAMGSVVTKSTDENGFYMGFPAKKQEKSAIDVY